MLKRATSLWSADLANLGSEIRRVEPYTTRFHLDVADGHYVPQLLFFPDLVRQLRPYTRLPFEVHLMVTDPLAWIAPFAEAGANTILFTLDAAPDPAQVLKAIRARGLLAGVSLLITEDLHLLDNLWGELDIVTIVGTAMGIKGAGLDPAVPDKIRRARDLVDARGLPVEIQADGGIRRETVPLLATAGAHSIVPGSLMFKEDPEEMMAWLRTVPTAASATT